MPSVKGSNQQFSVGMRQMLRGRNWRILDLYLFLDCTRANMDLYPLPSFQQGILVIAFGLFYALIRVIYNLFFHPLSHFPGPRGAACTRWWLAYTELGKGVSLSTLRAELHKKYGMSSTLLLLD